MKSAIFIERDGILNLARVEGKHQVSPLSLETFELNPHAVAPLRRLKKLGFLLLATTNQPGLSRGTLPRRELDRMHQLLQTTFQLDDILVCPHGAEEHCPCRRPKAGLFLEASFKWKMDLERSFVISDKWQDAHAAHLAGCTSLLLRSPWNGSGHHDFVLDDLVGVAEKVEELQSSCILSMNQDLSMARI